MITPAFVVWLLALAGVALSALDSLQTRRGLTLGLREKTALMRRWGPLWAFVFKAVTLCAAAYSSRWGVEYAMVAGVAVAIFVYRQARAVRSNARVLRFHHVAR